MMTDTLRRRVSAFWPGGELPLLAGLAVRSYLAHGFEMQLFVYRPCSNVPEGTVLRDASGVIPESLAFSHDKAGWEPFSNWFRNTLLAREGGLWTELDVVSLNRDDIPELPWFPEREPRVYGTGLIGFPPGHPVMECLRQFSEDPAAVMPWDGLRETESKKQFARDYPDVFQRRKIAPPSSYGDSVFTAAIVHGSLERYSSPASSVYPIHESSWLNCYNGWLHLQSSELRDSRAVCLWGTRLAAAPDVLENVDKNSIVGQLLDTYLPSSPATEVERKKVDLLIGICSCCKARDRRQAVRDTWLKHSVNGIKSVFFVGHRTPLEDEKEDTVTLWASDTYARLPEKVLEFFRYALEHYDFKWLFKCDDDSYVALDRLKGLIDGEAELIGDTSLEGRGAPSGGAGYCLSRRMVEKIVSEQNIPPTGPEDIIFGELALKLGAVPKSTSLLCMHSGRYPLPDNEQVSSHWCKPLQLHALEHFYHCRPLAVYKARHVSWTDEIEVYEGGFFRRRGTGCSGQLSHKGNGIFGLGWFHWNEELLVRTGSNLYTGDKLALEADSGEEDIACLIAPDFAAHATDVQPLCIRIGDESRKMEGWVHLGLLNNDIKHPVPLPDACVDAYYLEHVLECVSFRDALGFFHEAWRTLKPGGIMRIAVADISRIMDYAGMIVPELSGQLQDGQPSVMSLLVWMEDKLEHRSFWTRELLEVCLKSVGYDVAVREAGQSSHHLLSGLEPPQSIFTSTLPSIETVCLEIVKPSI